MLRNQENTNDIPSDTPRELTGKRQFARQLLARIEVLRKSRGANRARELSRLEGEILLYLDPKNNEALINTRVKEANFDFFNKMYSLHPQLTDNELLFCAYIRMKLLSTDIASLKGIDSKSVNMARYRLKKKLALELGTDLDNYLQTII